MRLIFYVLAWLCCNLTIAACMAALGGIAAFYLVVGPLSGVYVAVRLGTWLGMGLPTITVMIVGGLCLFGSVRIPLWRHLLRRVVALRRCLCLAMALRDDLWRQYHLPRRIAPGREPEGE